MVIHGKVKKAHIAKAFLGTIWWTALSCYHYGVGINKYILIYMILSAISGIYDTICAISWYRKQEKNIRPTDFF